MNSAIFIDRDGTVSEEVGYIYHTGLYKPFTWTGPAIRRINESGMKAVLVTNQSGIGRKYFTLDTLNEVHKLLVNELAKSNAHFDAIYYCPHLPDAGCYCRKPNPGMLLRAQVELDVDLSRSYVVGDRYVETHLAHRVQARGVLVLTGDGEKELMNRRGEDEQPDLVSENLLTAVETILSGE